MRFTAKFIFTSLACFLLVWLSLRFLLPFFLPFLLGLGLAMAAEPVVRFFSSKMHLPRFLSSGLGVTFSFFLISCLVLGILAFALQGLRFLSGILPDLEMAVSSGITLLESWLLSLALKAPQSVRPFLQQQVLALFSDSTAFLQKGAAYILALAGGVLTHIPGQAFTFFTAIISGYMISSKLPGLQKWMLTRISSQRLRSLLDFLRRMKKALGHFLLAQLKLAGISLLILTMGLILLKIPYAPVWALAISLLDALPVLGTGTVLIPWSLISFLQHNPPKALGLLGIYVIVSLVRSLLEPRLVGRQLGLDPLVTLISLYTGFRLWGFAGMILSPLLAVAAAGILADRENPEKNF